MRLTHDAHDMPSMSRASVRSVAEELRSICGYALAILPPSIRRSARSGPAGDYPESVNKPRSEWGGSAEKPLLPTHSGPPGALPSVGRGRCQAWAEGAAKD